MPNDKYFMASDIFWLSGHGQPRNICSIQKPHHQEFYEVFHKIICIGRPALWISKHARYVIVDRNLGKVAPPKIKPPHEDESDSTHHHDARGKEDGSGKYMHSLKVSAGRRAELHNQGERPDRRRKCMCPPHRGMWRIFGDERQGNGYDATRRGLKRLEAFYHASQVGPVRNKPPAGRRDEDVKQHKHAQKYNQARRRFY
mmetsp:Transcript_20550/g.46625  ORF Transcript_20550/g.46625 Transcript_20550/m.46625 type:complete len:200 (+) Transcript_20550:152-751(+)